MTVFLLLVAGAAAGAAAVWADIRLGLTREEWTYLKAFYCALLAGSYETVKDEETRS